MLIVITYQKRYAEKIDWIVYSFDVYTKIGGTFESKSLGFDIDNNCPDKKVLILECSPSGNFSLFYIFI